MKKMNVFSMLFLFSFSAFTFGGEKTLKIPIIFHKKYDISFLGLERLHPFDSTKYGKVHADISAFLKKNEKEQGLINRCTEKIVIKWMPVLNPFYTPEKVSDEELLLAHTPRYLESLKTSSVVERIAELPGLSWVPNILLQWNLLDPMRYATGGTILGAKLALQEGWAINLSGGYHHAKSDKQRGGFCFYADIPIAVKSLWKENQDLKVLIVDLDAHQGNGHEEILGTDKRVAIFDVYNESAYPNNYDHTRQFIDYDYPIFAGIISSKGYLQLLRDNLPRVIQEFQPDLIIYNAGTDILAGDPVGGMSVSEDAIIERDLFVFDEAEKSNTPILMVLSGGYTSESAPIIGKSIKQILQKKGY